VKGVRSKGRAGTLALRITGVILATILLAMSFGSEGQAFEAEEVVNPIVQKFLDATRKQQDAFRGTKMEVDIDAQLPKLKEQGKMKVLKIIPKVGEVIYHRLGEFVGDHTIETEVIKRYLELKNDSPENASIAITPANYHFRLKTRATGLAGSKGQVYVFDLKPKKNEMGLFKGELWLDAATGMPVKETGTLVKTPLFVKKVAFVNEFQLQDGVAWPSHIECHVEVRVAGRADLNIHFSNPTQSDEGDVAEVAVAP
jgi:hypothetical protein